MPKSGEVADARKILELAQKKKIPARFKAVDIYRNGVGGLGDSQGKAIARQNATKHGLLTQNLIVLDEDPHELCDLRERLYSALSPQGALEELIVEKIINAAWRLKRLVGVEHDTIEHKSVFGNASAYRAFHEQASTILTIACYEAAMERTFYRALHELQRLQAMRLGCTELAQIAIEINNGSD